MTDDDKQAIRDMIRGELEARMGAFEFDAKFERRFELFQDHIDVRFDEWARESDNVMRQQLTISAANSATLASLNGTLATVNGTLVQIGARLEAMAARTISKTASTGNEGPGNDRRE